VHVQIRVIAQSLVTDGTEALLPPGKLPRASGRGLGLAPPLMASGRRERFDGCPCDRKFSPACSWRANTSSISNGQNGANVLGRTNFTSDCGSRVNQSLLYAPESVSSDPTNDRLFVTDSGNNRALVFKVAKIINGMNASKVLGQADFTTRDSYTTQSGFNNPHQVFYNRGSGRLFVSDYNNHRVMVFEGDARHPNFIKVMSHDRPCRSRRVTQRVLMLQ
jgi:hypothetical protein